MGAGTHLFARWTVTVLIGMVRSPDLILPQHVSSPGSSNTLRQFETQGSPEPLALATHDDDVEQGVVIRVADATDVSSIAPAPRVDTEVTDISQDLWSAAYREAVESLGEDVNSAILKGASVADLFHQLEQIEKDTSDESIFLRGVRYLQSLQVPLERFKLALDLASPLTSIEPTTATVFGVVKSATAVSSNPAADILTI